MEFTKQTINIFEFSQLDGKRIEAYVYKTKKDELELTVTYHVTWCLVGPGEQALDNDRFPEAFANYEDAVGYILERIDRTPSFGYDSAREFWWLRGNTRMPTETRFWISKTEATNIHQMRKLASG